MITASKNIQFNFVKTNLNKTIIKERGKNMKTTKRIISTLLTFIMILTMISVIPMTVSAAAPKVKTLSAVYISGFTFNLRMQIEAFGGDKPCKEIGFHIASLTNGVADNKFRDQVRMTGTFDKKASDGKIYEKSYKFPATGTYRIRAYGITVYGDAMDSGYVDLTLMPPAVTTQEASVSGDTITLKMNITADGGAPITEAGWWIRDPTRKSVNTTVFVKASPIGKNTSYTATFKVPNADTYTYRAYAVNRYGTGEGTAKDVYVKGITYKISTTVSPSNGGTVVGGGTYDEGSKITLKATPNSGWEFEGWYENGTKVSTNENYTFTVSSARTLQAIFKEKPQKSDIITITGVITEGIVINVPKGGNFKFPTNMIIKSENLRRVYAHVDGWSNMEAEASISSTTASFENKTLNTKILPVGVYTVYVYAANTSNPGKQICTFKIKIVDLYLDLVSGIGHNKYEITQGNELRLNSGAVRSDGKITKVWLDIVNSSDISVGISKSLDNLYNSHISIENVIFNTKDLPLGKYQIVVWACVDTGVNGIEQISIRLPLQIPVDIVQKNDSSPLGSGDLRIKTFSRTTDMNYQLSANFKVSEFACPCGCPKIYVSMLLVDILEEIKSNFNNKSIYVTSGFRCQSWETRQGRNPGGIAGYTNWSNHTWGTVADIYIANTGTYQHGVSNDVFKVAQKILIEKEIIKSYTGTPNKNNANANYLYVGDGFVHIGVGKPLSTVLNYASDELAGSLNENIPEEPITDRTWTNYQGSWVDENGKLTTAGGHSYALDKSIKYKDFMYTATVTPKEQSNGSASGDAGLMWRVQDDVNDNLHGKSYYVGLYPGDGCVRLYGPNVSGSVDCGIKPEVGYKVAIIASGKNMKVYIDDKLIFDIAGNNSTFLEGYIGVRTWYCPATISDITIKDNLISEIPANETTPLIDFKYSIESDAVTITGYTGNSEKVVIPSYIEGKPVTKIGNRVFDGKKFKSVTLPDKLTYIGEYAFSYLRDITEIKIPAEVTFIGRSAFEGSNLSSIVIPSKVNSIGIYAFGFCGNLKSAYFEGNAPANFADNAFGYTHHEFKIYFNKGASGWTSPKWNNYSTEMISE